MRFARGERASVAKHRSMNDKSQSQTSEQMPQTIGRYQVSGSIGYGAMGAVYKAFDPLIKRTLAIKTIRLDIPRQSPPS